MVEDAVVAAAPLVRSEVCREDAPEPFDGIDDGLESPDDGGWEQ